MTKQQIYYTIVKRYGWYELHVSADKTNVKKLCALSKKTPVTSKFAEQHLTEWTNEMRIFKAKRIVLYVDCEAWLAQVENCKKREAEGEWQLKLKGR